MRNLKKILALVLAMVMAFSVMSVAGAFSDDEDFDGNYAEAATVLEALGVFQGYPDETFRPEQTITRAEVAALIYRIATDDTGDKNIGLYKYNGPFSDVPAEHWAAGYINYCANAEYIRGTSATTFDPEAKVTGYQALAMILRVVGYDKNKEFTGNDWEIQVARIANDLQITGTVAGVSLRDAAPRQIVAELLFQTLINAKLVNYTPALGYQSATLLGFGAQTLGQKVFQLTDMGEVYTYAGYGRPSKLWNARGGYLVDIPYTPVYSATKPADECDVAAAMGLYAPATVSQAWLDGVDITKITTLTGSNSTIDPLYVTRGTNIIGDQGRLTEIYRLANGTYSIVEINTYFAEVSQVVNSVLDKNGHPSAAYSMVKIYDSLNTEKPAEGMIYTTEYSVGQTLLVTLDGGYVASYETVAPTVTGRVTAFSQRTCNDNPQIKDTQARVIGTVTVDKTTYTDADKFYVGYPTVADNTLYNVYFDKDGNVIAMMPVGYSATYGVINAIRWNSPNIGTTVGGYVTANLTLADGSVVTDVIVSKINGSAPISVDYGPGDPTPVDTENKATTPTVSNVYTQNTKYYGHLITYIVNTDNTYELSVMANDECAIEQTLTKDMTEATITKGKSTIYGKVTDAAGEQINTAYASDATVFLYYNGNYGYDVYVGYNNAPSITGATICYLVSTVPGVAGGRVTLAVVNGKLTDSTIFQAYLASTVPAYVSSDGKTLYNVYNLYKLGSTEATQIAVAQGSSEIPTKAGFYTVTANKGIASSLTLVASYPELGADVKDNNTYTNHYFDITRALTAVVENSIATRTGGVANKNFSNMVNAKYLLVKNGVVTEGKVEDVKADDIIAVFYDKETVQVGALQQDIFTPVYVYVYEDGITGDENQDVPGVATYGVKFDSSALQGNVFDSANVLIPDGTTKTSLTGTYTFVVVTGTTAPTVTTDTGTLALVGSNTATGVYTYTISGVAKDATANITIK